MRGAVVACRQMACGVTAAIAHSARRRALSLCSLSCLAHRAANTIGYAPANKRVPLRIAMPAITA